MEIIIIFNTKNVFRHYYFRMKEALGFKLTLFFEIATAYFKTPKFLIVVLLIKKFFFFFPDIKIDKKSCQNGRSGS